MTISLIIISKDEPTLEATLRSLRRHIALSDHAAETEVLVVDASQGRLEHVRISHPWVRWLDFPRPSPARRITIPHQRNAGVLASESDVIVFTDSGCLPQERWLDSLLAPIESGAEHVTVGPASAGYDLFSRDKGAPPPTYVHESGTGNMALTRGVFQAVGGFDERFSYGSDIDFTWRLVASGFRIRYVPDAVVDHDWGNLARRIKRSRQYGAARIRLYRKHTSRLKTVLRDDPVPFVFALWILGLPLALRWRSYLLLLLIPLWRARRRPFPFQVVLSHIAMGVGSLEELTNIARGRRP
jgi:hypothetical protein